ncbi:MAG: hypothetical protein ACT4P6_11080 [Gemmatimonadaceae bacterium]
MTLVELIGGLAIGGIVLALAVRMVTGLYQAVDGLEDATISDARSRNGMRWLAERLRAATIPNDSQPFVGLSTSLSFDSHRARQSTPTVTEQINLEMANRSIVARIGADTLLLVGDVERLEIDYLTARGLDSRWHQTWVSTASLPTALRLRLTKVGTRSERVDTVLLAVRLLL